MGKLGMNGYIFFSKCVTFYRMESRLYILPRLAVEGPGQSSAHCRSTALTSDAFTPVSPTLRSSAPENHQVSESRLKQKDERRRIITRRC